VGGGVRAGGLEILIKNVLPLPVDFFLDREDGHKQELVENFGAATDVNEGAKKTLDEIGAFRPARMKFFCKMDFDVSSRGLVDARVSRAARFDPC
jgi:hypothetical protein